MFTAELSTEFRNGFWSMVVSSNACDGAHVIAGWVDSEIRNNISWARQHILDWKAGNKKHPILGGTAFYWEEVFGYVFIEFMFNADEPCDEDQYLLMTIEQALKLLAEYESHMKERKKVLVSENIPELTFTAEYIAAGKEALKLADELGEQMLKECETGEVVKH